MIVFGAFTLVIGVWGVICFWAGIYTERRHQEQLSQIKEDIDVG